MAVISIIVPFYNRAFFLKETLFSILKQTYDKFEILIIDDESEKSQFEDIESYVKSLNDFRIRLLKKPKTFPRGANGSRNFGFYQAKGDYVKWFDSDDVMNPDFLSVQMTKFKENPQLDGVIANCGVYNDDFSTKINSSWRNKIFSQLPLQDYLRGQLAWQTGAGLWKKSSLTHFDPFCQDVTNGQEFIFHLFALTSSFQLLIIEKEMFKVRTHSNAISKHRTENYLMNRFKARVICLTRLIYTRNFGKRYLIKSLLSMYLKNGFKNNKQYIKFFYENFKLQTGQNRRAFLKKGEEA